MSISTSVASKVINLFFVMIMGMVLRKTSILDKKSTSTLSSMLVNITNPFLVICALQKDYDSSLVKNAFIILGLSVFMHVLTAVIGTFSFKFEKVRSKEKIYSFAMIFANCGFLGYPVLQALMGDELGLFYGVFFTLFFNIFCWTYGVVLMNDGKGMAIRDICKKIFLNPSFISVIVGFCLFMLRIPVPGIIFEGMDYIGNMTFPLSMLIVGSLFCELELKTVLNDKVLYWYLILKLVIFPVAMIYVSKYILMDVLGLPNMFAYLLVTMCSMPAASNTAIMADYYNADKLLAAKTVSISTLFSVVTIPTVMIIANHVFGALVMA
ncbi:MAG: AEC family transporter [Ruminococcaceae bacterium]|nr:AEC family transporter [Oscillospiraceae bacterium]